MTVPIKHRSLCIGVDVSQRHQPGAICVTEIQNRGGWEAHHRHWVVRFLERLPAGTRLPQLTQRLQQVFHGALRRYKQAPQVLGNATGIGRPVVEALTARIESHVYTVYFNQGDRRSLEGDFHEHIVVLGKAYLVSAVQTALQTERLHLPRRAEYDQLAEELLSFEIDLPPDANERYGSFRVGSRDEMVNALGLTVQHEPGLETGIGGAGDYEDCDNDHAHDGALY